MHPGRRRGNAGRGLGLADSLDFRAEGEEFFVDVFVAAVDVVEAVDFGGSLGGEGGDDQCGRSAEVGGHDGGGGEALDAAHDGGAVVHGDVGVLAVVARIPVAEEAGPGTCGLPAFDIVNIIADHQSLAGGYPPLFKHMQYRCRVGFYMGKFRALRT